MRALNHIQILKGSALACLILLSACTTPRPRHVDNICKIFKQYPSWYWASSATAKRWGVPIPVQLAIIHQESRFTADARPPRTKLLWIIPWKRPSSSYGYSQALKQTWSRYRAQTGKHIARRDEFDDAVDFIGWYVNLMHQKLGLLKNDTYQIYLAYHEGIGGFSRGTYKNKAWLQRVGVKVHRRSLIYDAQLKQCRSQLPKKPWYRFW